MTLRKSILTSIAAGTGVVAASAFSATAGPSMGSSLGECYNNWVSYCNSTTPGYPNQCYTDSLNLCDQEHKNAASQIPGTSLQAMKSSSLRKATRTTTVATPTTLKPARSTN
ncbi:hypothetical protein [Labrenzia sp. CE80]|uniref:hypothetical protein n=1 Tax=Labrenzia sp. CE80 TaxID=1788986 RepID=UPI00129AA2D3|nr:hypothetical protein [Labrenzia sp. CE80]